MCLPPANRRRRRQRRHRNRNSAFVEFSKSIVTRLNVWQNRDMNGSDKETPDSELALRVVAKLWPHRQHESNSLLGMFCRVGLHRWRRLNTANLFPDNDCLLFLVFKN